MHILVNEGSYAFPLHTFLGGWSQTSWTRLQQHPVSVASDSFCSYTSHVRLFDEQRSAFCHMRANRIGQRFCVVFMVIFQFAIVWLHYKTKRWHHNSVIGFMTNSPLQHYSNRNYDTRLDKHQRCQPLKRLWRRGPRPMSEQKKTWMWDKHSLL